MAQETFFDKVRDFIGSIAWVVFLWSIQMTEDEYLNAVVNRPLVSQDALYLASVWDTLVENGYLTEEFVDNHTGVISAATLASKTLAQMAASES